MVKIRIFRTKEWCNSEAARTGRSEPSEITIEVDPANLSPAARSILLAANGGEGVYPFSFDGTFNHSYEFHPVYSTHGRVDLVIDRECPTNAEISGAIVLASSQLAAKRAESERKQREREERKQREREEQAERQRKMEEAHALLGPEIERLNKAITLLREDVSYLCEVLAHVPDLQGVVEILADRDGEKRITEIKDRLESISPVVLFSAEE